MGETPDTWVTPDSDSSCSESAAADAPPEGKLPHRHMQRPLPAEVSAAADLLQELSLSGVTHVSEVPLIYLITSDASIGRIAAPVSQCIFAEYQLVGFVFRP